MRQRTLFIALAAAVLAAAALSEDGAERDGPAVRICPEDADGCGD